MNRAQTLGKGQRPLDRGHHHVPAGLAVRAVSNSLFQPAHTDGALNTIIGDGFERRIDRGNQDGFDTVGHRVHACGGGQASGQAQGQVRIADRHAGDQVRRDKGLLAAIVQHDHRADRNL